MAADFLAYVGAKVCQIFVEVVAQETTGWIREKMAKAVAEVAFREGGHLTP